MPLEDHVSATDSKFPLKSVGRRLMLFSSVATLTMLALIVASPSRAQEYGYSYLRMDADGHPVANLVTNEKYEGWLQLVAVEARIPTRPKRDGKIIDADMLAKKTALHRRGWTTLPVIMHEGRSGPGQLRVAAGDDGGLSGLIDAQKRKTFIPQAELVLYDEQADTLIGKFRIKGIRILSLEDVPASACPMYEITLSFRSISKE